MKKHDLPYPSAPVSWPHIALDSAPAGSVASENLPPDTPRTAPRHQEGLAWDALIKYVKR